MIGRYGDLVPVSTGPKDAPSGAINIQDWLPTVASAAGQVIQSAQDPVQKVGVAKADLDAAILAGKPEKTIAELRAKYLAAQRAAQVQVSWEAQQARIGYLVELGLGSAVLLGFALSAAALIRAVR